MTEEVEHEQDNLMAALSYLLMPLTGIVIYLSEREDKYVRFHAIQATILGILFLVLLFFIGILAIVFTFIPVVGWIINILAALGYLMLYFVFWVFLMYKAYSGDRFGLPGIGRLAEKNI